MAFLQVITHPHKTHQSFSITIWVGFLLHSSQRLELLITLHRVFPCHIISSRLSVLHGRSDVNHHHQLVISSSDNHNTISMLHLLANRDTHHQLLQLDARSR